MKINPKIKAYTLAELATVVLIIGILAVLVLPKLGLVIERMRAQEGVRLLMALYKAQKEYVQDGVLTHVNCPSGCFAKGIAWTNPSFQDYMELPTPLEWNKYYQNFNIPTLGCGKDDPCSTMTSECKCESWTPANEIACNFADPNNQGVLAQIKRNGSSPYDYTLFVTEEGRVICGDPNQSGAAVCGGICKKLGFPNDW